MDKGVPDLVMIPAQVFILVCGYRCIFPNRYNECVVLHDTWLSSIWLTRCLATFSETFWLWQLAYLNRDLNQLMPGGPQMWIDVCSWVIVFLVCFAQCCVWASMMFETDILMWYEEFNWLFMFVLNTAINIVFFFSGGMESSDPRWTCVYLSLVFGAIFLPFQIIGHLPYIVNVDRAEKQKKEKLNLTCKQINKGCWRVMVHRKATNNYADWGHFVGAFWMFGYWILEPFWLLYVAYTYSLYHASL